MKRYILIYMISLIFISCATSSKFTEYRETITRDTIISLDSVKFKIHLKGDSLNISSKEVDINEVISSKKIDISPIEVTGQFSTARADFSNNKLNLQLIERDIILDSTFYIKRIKILENRLQEKNEKETIIQTLFWWENSWFWISCFLIAIDMICIIILIRIKL